MDRPRARPKGGLGETLGRWIRGGLLALGLVALVAAIPASLLWLLGPEDAVTASEAADPDSIAPPPPRAEPVTFTSGVTPLSGILYVPGNEGPHPAVVVVHGSGRVRAEDLASVGSELAHGGVMALTYDKRGVGDSGGTYATVGVSSSDRVLEQLARDTRAAVSFLRVQRDVRTSRIGLAGLSQGGWIAPLAATGTDDVSFMILYSGPTVSVGEEVYYSELTGDDGTASTLTDPEIARRLAEYDGPRGFDPVPSLRALDIPSLWLLGGRDRSIPIPETIAILDSLHAEGKPFTYHLFPEADHGLRTPAGEREQTWPVVANWLNDSGLLR